MIEFFFCRFDDSFWDYVKFTNIYGGMEVCCLDVETCNTYLTFVNVNNIKAKDMVIPLGIDEGVKVSFCKDSDFQCPFLKVWMQIFNRSYVWGCFSCFYCFFNRRITSFLNNGPPIIFEVKVCTCIPWTIRILQNNVKTVQLEFKLLCKERVV